MSKAKQPKAEYPFAAAGVAAELVRWRAHLAAERRMSPLTVEAYQRDVGQFLAFLAEHLGGAPSLAALARIEVRDVRAFMAARRAVGITSRSLTRALAAARSFARFLERNGNKTRMVPVLPQVLELIAAYAALCPHALPADGPLFVGARGGPLSPRIVQLVMEGLRGALGLPDSAT